MAIALKRSAEIQVRVLSYVHYGPYYVDTLVCSTKMCMYLCTISPSSTGMNESFRT